MQCTRCELDGKLSRTKRAGLFEEHIYPLFGYFPWICSGCKARILQKSRGERKRLPREHESGSTPTARNIGDGLHSTQ